MIFDISREILAQLHAENESKRATIPTDASFGKFIEKNKTRVGKLVGKLGRGTIEPQEFRSSMLDLLERAHTDAVIMGRMRAGDLTPEEEDDLGFARLVMREQEAFLDRFIRKIEAGGYTNEDGSLKTDQITRRAGQYVNRTRGTANDTFVLASGLSEMFGWFQLAAEPCQDCPRLEAGGPYRGDLLPTKPGMGQTQCKTNCGCVLVRISDGQIGFSRSYE